MLNSFGGLENKTIIGGDTNAKSSRWGADRQNLKSDTIIGSNTLNNIVILNRGNIPTFARREQKSYIDITICKDRLYNKVVSWEVNTHEENLSLHRNIYFQIQTDKDHHINEQIVRWKLSESKVPTLAKKLTKQLAKLNKESSAEEYASKLLTDRYDDDSPLIASYIYSLIDLPVISKGNSQQLREFIKNVKQLFGSLENLNQSVSQWDVLLAYLLLRKLDNGTRTAFQLNQKPKEIPTVDKVLKFIEERAIAFEASNLSKFESTNSLKQTNVTTSSNSKSKNSFNCKFCDARNHKIFKCNKFKNLKAPERITFINNKSLCKLCLDEHDIKNCGFLNKYKCKHCAKLHNNLLHISEAMEGNPAIKSQGVFQDKNDNESQVQLTLCNNNKGNTNVILPVVKIGIYSSDRQLFVVKGLLDSGSQLSFITDELYKKLKISSFPKSLSIFGITKQESKTQMAVLVKIYSCTSSYNTELLCSIMPEITNNLPTSYFDKNEISLPKNVNLSNPEFNIPDKISILLGADVLGEILEPGSLIIPNSRAKLLNTKFGYVVIENVNQDLHKSANLATALIVSSNEVKLTKLINKFWEVERVPEIFSKRSSKQQLCEETFRNSVKNIDNRFQVDLPLKQNLSDVCLGNSSKAASIRFFNLEKRFKRDPKLFLQYKEFIDEYVTSGNAKMIDLKEYEGKMDTTPYFLAHHPVIRNDKRTTQIRVVFDGGLKSSKNISLNDVILNGPVVQNELFDILILFRSYKYILINDTRQMYRSVMVHHNFKSFQNILWRDNPEEELKCLQLQTVTWGLKPSAYLATRCLIELADKYKDKYPLAAAALENNTYIDDILCGANDIEETLSLQNELISLLMLGHFQLHKWVANSSELLRNIPPEKCYFDNIKFDKNNNDYVKTLGFLGPITTNAKIIMQRICCSKISWDETLPPDLYDMWKTFAEGLISMPSFEIKRDLNFAEAETTDVLGFCDASNVAYGCAIYCRYLHPFLDRYNILRVTGRLQNAKETNYSQKHPIILPKRSHITNLIIQNEHKILMHAGQRHVLASLSQKFWIISAIREIKKNIHKCFTCFKLKAKTTEQLMGSLPVGRVNQFRPFLKTGMDFFGSFSVRHSGLKRAIVTKAYVCPFICFSTKAIHFELCSDLTTDTFLACLKRFVSRRGTPSDIYCDNMSTYKGAANELKKLFDFCHSKNNVDKIENNLSAQRIQFHFIPSYSPVFGGLWEAGVESSKHYFEATIGDTRLRYEELNTVIIQVEGILNSRPITPFSLDINNLTYLTPGHFLSLEGFHNCIPEENIINIPCNRLKSWRICTQIKQNFWNKWYKDYLNQLQTRYKWFNKVSNLKEGMLVLIKNDNVPCQQWPIARITKVFPGKDNKVRVVEVKTSNGSVTKIAVLPFNGNKDN
ncbi:hypothetical protein ILUMI_22407 [Ignelater luminosus]|uniref:Endonuclease n=1 Tax=Ignelater luminosus TaxID=2038154 RepID=A0A8K0CGS7_IGNLU|nr:hypothetical protein ILUMI_22407 [Ignelater luminosus]